MIDFGRFNPFNWHTSQAAVNTHAVYKFPAFSFIVNGTVTTATRIKLSDLSESSLTKSVKTWDIDGNTLTATVISPTGSVGVQYIYKIVIGSNTYYSDVIEIIGSDCVLQIGTTNSCNNTNYPFADNPSVFNVNFPDVQWQVPTTEDEYETIITSTGEERRLIGQITRHEFWFVQPKWFANMLTGLRTNDGSFLGSSAIKGIEFEYSELGDGIMAAFKLSFEYVGLHQGNSCCDDVDLDDILSPGGGSGGACDDFVIEIDNTSDTLSVDATDPPIGTPSYRWYRNGVLISTASTIAIVQSGDYRVDVTIAGCRATASYYKDDVCGLFSVDVYSSGNFVNADLSNVPDGCTPTYSVILNGSEVATSVPFEVAATGTYFVKVTACNCVKSGAVYIVYSAETNCDFTLDIDITGSTLSADTDASSPSYLWEFEDETGRTTVGTSISITAQNRGIYWLTVTDGGCSKETYVYLAPSSQTGVVVLYKATGYQFDVIGINLLGITNFANDIIVTINGDVHTYTSDTTPDSANLYSVNGSGQLVTRSATPFTNATIVIKTL